MLKERGFGTRPLAGLLSLLMLVGVAAVVLSFGVASAAAASITVRCHFDGGSPDLQATIDSGLYSTIYIQGVCVGNFQVDGKTVTLQGIGSKPTLDGDGSGTVLTVKGGSMVTVAGLRIQDGSAASGGGIFVMGCGNTVNLNGSLVFDNEADEGGGANVDCGTLNLMSSHVDGNFRLRGRRDLYGRRHGVVVKGARA